MTLRSRSQLPPASADALLVWPRGGNSGDMLILNACERYLRDRGIAVWRSDGSIEEAVLAGDNAYLGDLFASHRGILVFPGGGNVGIYHDNGAMRGALISRMRPRQRCLVMPQSAAAPEASLADPRVTVWCRDRVSQSILAQSGVRTELVPDAALYMDDRIAKPPPGTGVFYVRREPGGDTESIEHGLGRDWPAGDLTLRGSLDDIVARLADYETVVSDRLHGGLIALMMRRKVILLPVGYHKIAAFHATWLASTPGVGFAATAGELDHLLATLAEPGTSDLKELFTRHADPALQRFLFAGPGLAVPRPPSRVAPAACAAAEPERAQARPEVIVIAAKDPLDAHGGAESYVRAMGRAAIRAGYAPHIFCVSRSDEVVETGYGTVHRTRSPVRPLRGLMLALHAPFLIRDVVSFALQREGPHLVHSIGSWSGIGDSVARRLRRRGRRVRHVTTPFTTYNHETRGKLAGLRAASPWQRRLQFQAELLWTRLTVDPSERRGMRGADLVAPNYDSVRAIVDEEFGPGIAFGKLAYASELAFVAPAELPPVPELIAALEPRDAPLIVSVSRHDPRKGLDVLLRALAELTARGVRYRACLCGPGDLLEHHRALARTLGLGPQVTIPGGVPDAFAFLRHADIYALPSVEEGSGAVALLEALQAGVAPVVSRIDGVPEDVDHMQSAILVTPGSVTELADALQACIADPLLRARLAGGAQARFWQRFSAERYAEDLGRVYSSLGFPAGSTRT